jgi:hypothetical protein
MKEKRIIHGSWVIPFLSVVETGFSCIVLKDTYKGKLSELLSGLLSGLLDIF